ncbi:MAG: hypothetical protein O9353_12555 [Bacteroidia bacterium]|nr:hypothetical protein [Bacteroidia bacterium]
MWTRIVDGIRKITGIGANAQLNEAESPKSAQGSEAFKAQATPLAQSEEPAAIAEAPQSPSGSATPINSNTPDNYSGDWRSVLFDKMKHQINFEKQGRIVKFYANSRNQYSKNPYNSLYENPLYSICIEPFVKNLIDVMSNPNNEFLIIINDKPYLPDDLDETGGYYGIRRTIGTLPLKQYTILCYTIFDLFGGVRTGADHNQYHIHLLRSFFTGMNADLGADCRLFMHHDNWKPDTETVSKFNYNIDTEYFAIIDIISEYSKRDDLHYQLFELMKNGPGNSQGWATSR